MAGDGGRVPERWNAPWTDEQVVTLAEYQASGRFHPYTCGADSSHGPLTPTRDGWVCESCPYSQGWAHAHGRVPDVSEQRAEVARVLANASNEPVGDRHRGAALAAVAALERDEAGVVYALRRAVSALGAAAVAFRKLDEGVGYSPHIAAGDAKRAEDHATEALRRYDREHEIGRSALAEFQEGLARALNRHGVPAMPSWDAAIDWLAEHGASRDDAPSDPASVLAALLAESPDATVAAIEALGWKRASASE